MRVQMDRLITVLMVSLAPAVALPLEGQVQLEGVVISSASFAESHAGALNAINVPVVDSAEAVLAVGGEVAAAGYLSLFSRLRSSLRLHLSGAWRQTASWGFLSRDYAPTEWDGRADAEFRRWIRHGVFTTNFGIEARSIWDRPPMPLYKQPGVFATSASITYQNTTVGTARMDVRLYYRDADYGAPPNFRQLDLLDQRRLGIEVGSSWGDRGQNVEPWGKAGATMRFHMATDRAEYNSQNTFEPGDPHRSDRILRAGLSWSREGLVNSTFGLRVDLKVEGIASRSNSHRPEYDAFRAEGFAQLGFASGYSLAATAILHNKNYVHDTPFQRLVPGEEADNTSHLWLRVTREMNRQLDAHLQLEWVRAETDFSRAYVWRSGISLGANYRPAS